MIYSQKQEGKERPQFQTDIDVEKVAKEIEKKIKANSDIAYDGYDFAIDFGAGYLVINFYIKTADGRECISYDPHTLDYHIQNDLWITDFNQDSIYELLILFAQIRTIGMAKILGFSNTEIKRMLNGGTK